jgi:hypothetical protein
VTGRAAAHVLLIEPIGFSFNPETESSNVFQQRASPEEAAKIERAAPAQHRALRELLIANGVWVTVVRSRPDTPDAPFCNNWFSTHAGADRAEPTLVLYPMLAANRRTERRPDLIDLLRARYPCVVDLSAAERDGVFLEATGSLCLDDAARVAYAALSPRTDAGLLAEWAKRLGYRLVSFTATDADGVPYYHTNVMMFLAHGLAVVCLESIADVAERTRVEAALAAGGFEVVAITRGQLLAFCGNGLALTSDRGEPLIAMSTAAFHGFTPIERARLESRARILHTDLSAFERLGGGSARCLLGELV